MSFLVFIKDATDQMGVLSSNPANEPAVLVSASSVCSSAISSSTILDTNFSLFSSSVKLSLFPLHVYFNDDDFVDVWLLMMLLGYSKRF